MVDTGNGYPCPNCGCRDSRPVGQSTRWGFTGQRRQCRYCLMQFTPGTSEPMEVPAAEESAAGNGGGVIFRPVRCPECKSKETKVTSTPRPTAGSPQRRFHKCEACGAAFKSVEAD